MRNLIPATAIALIAASGLALAQGQAEPRAQSQAPAFDTLDADGNGYISSAEARGLPCLDENFDDVETESDEGLSPSEYRTAVAEHCQRDS